MRSGAARLKSASLCITAPALPTQAGSPGNDALSGGGGASRAQGFCHGRAFVTAKHGPFHANIHLLGRHGKNLNSDVWRQMQLWKATTENGGHPFAKFATGSYETLMSRPKVQTSRSAFNAPCTTSALDSHCRILEA